MARTFALVLVLHPVWCHAQAPSGHGTVFLEVPLMVQAPGFQSVVHAYHDGDRFFVDAARLMEQLGYSVTRADAQLTAADARHRLVMDFAEMYIQRPGAPPVSMSGHAVYSQGRYLLDVSALSRLFGADVFFDEARLSLTLSTAAEHFDTYALGRRAFLDSEVPGPVQFGRQRHFLGGITASWHATQQWHHGRPVYRDGVVHFTASALGGAVRGLAGRTAEATYLFDRPRRTHLTRVEVGRMTLHDGVPVRALRLSNVPLAALHVQRSATLRGEAPPHAMVEVTAAGQIVDRVQVGPDGQYRLRVPAYYGTTEALVRVQPMGGAAPYETQRYLVTTPALVPPGRLYYDAMFGTRHALRIRYGAGPRLTVQAHGIYGGKFHFGASASPWPFMVLSADVAFWPLALVQASAHLWRRHLRAEAAFSASDGQSHGHLVVYGQRHRMGAQLTGHLTQGGAGTAFRLAPSVAYHGTEGLAVRLQLETANDHGLHAVRWHAAATKTQPLLGGALQIGLFLRGMQGVQNGGVDALFSLRHGAVGAVLFYDPSLRRAQGKVAVQVRTRALGVASHATSTGTHTHSAYGSVSIGPGLRFTSTLSDETAALLRIFEDMDGDGVLDSGEPLLSGVDVQLFHAPLKRTASGLLRASYLEPYTTYQVRILEQSIRDPWLRPATGYSFSFIADPGRTKVLDIPLQSAPLVRGRVSGFERAASRLRVHAMRDGVAVDSAEVFRDGGFALRLERGPYRLRLQDVVDGSLLKVQTLHVPDGARIVDVTITSQ